MIDQTAPIVRDIRGIAISLAKIVPRQNTYTDSHVRIARSANL